MSDELKEALEFKGLVMRSIPDDTRNNFKLLAEKEFDNHYGLTLRELLNSYFEYQALKSKFLSGEIGGVVEGSNEGDNEKESPVDVNGNQIKFWRTQ